MILPIASKLGIPKTNVIKKAKDMCSSITLVYNTPYGTLITEVTNCEYNRLK